MTHDLELGEDIDLPDLHPSQEGIAEHGARFKVLACGRRWGKTTLGVLLCLTVGLQGGRAWWVSKTFDQSGEGWEPLKALAAEFPFAVIREARRTIYFKLPNGRVGRIQVRSADRPDTLRGAGLDLVVLDEAAHCDERAWTHSLRPALSDRMGRAFLISTPNGKNWFYKLWELGQDTKQDQWCSWQKPTWDSPYIEKSEIEQARRDSHPTVFSQEWGAQFLDLALVRPYKQEWLLDYDPAAIPPKGELYISIGVDPAISKKDTACQTAICVAGQAIRGHLQSTALILDHVAGHWSPYETADQIFALLRKWPARSVRIEDVAYQRALKDIVERESRDRGIPLPFLDLAKPELDKLRRALNVSPLVESGRVLFNPVLTALKRSLVSIPDDKASWDDADAFELSIQGLPVRGSARTKLERQDAPPPAVARAASYAVNAMQTVQRIRAQAAGVDPPSATYLGQGIWRRPPAKGPEGRRITQGKKRAASYATAGPLDRSRSLFGPSFGMTS